MDRNAQRLQIDRNYDAFERRLPGYLPAHRGEYALMRDAQVIGFYATVREASREGSQRFPDDIFSIQEVIDEPIDLGIFSHAGR